ncbi:ArsR/SmtB family transcription factor [Actinopolyspora saharensis]|uniref:DNA-binding transcriptional regulator, ArsR family n=1 Tax=Actinopolyspora saharensis TaxID=995062 RepID=A0A1H1AKF5_9ACTN|nr:metalloregulator ArsR/SmtB family transcription factor [Actinopolyspora saharensis]SDQ39676.1 DNA-binding transcriptional regulator, ArsR family [Actinopolyspora saharensis]
MGHGLRDATTPTARLDHDSAVSVAETLQALATPSRLLILSELRQGARSVNQLAEAVGMGQSAVSHQLRVLRSLWLVKGDRAGRAVVYSLYDTHVAQFLDEAVHRVEHLHPNALERQRSL